MKNLKFLHLYHVAIVVFVLGCKAETSIRSGGVEIDKGAKTGVPNPPGSDKLLSPAFRKARAVLDKSCLSCHATGTFGWNIPPEADEQIWINSSPQGLIVPGDAAASRIVKYMIYSQNGIMPYLSMSGPKASTEQFPRASYDAIIDWIESLEEENAAGGAGGTLEEGLIQLPNEYLKIGDRNYVYNFFKEVFGPTADPDARNNIHNKILPFGGPCIVGMGYVAKASYCFHMDSKIDTANGSVAPSGFIDAKHYDRVDIAASSAATNPESSSVREAYRTYTCEKLLLARTHSTTFSGPLYFALQSIHDNKNLFEGNPDSSLNFNIYPAVASVPTVVEIRAAHRVFFDFREPSEAVIAALLKVAQAAKDKITTPANGFPLRFEPWRYVLLTMCTAPETQVQ